MSIEQSFRYDKSGGFDMAQSIKSPKYGEKRYIKHYARPD